MPPPNTDEALELLARLRVLIDGTPVRNGPSEDSTQPNLGPTVKNTAIVAWNALQASVTQLSTFEVTTGIAAVHPHQVCEMVDLGAA